MGSDLQHNKRVVTLEGLDRIRSLPNEVIDKILKNVPIKTVVQTCILSKSWKNKWKFVPCLLFDKTCSISSSIQGGPTQDSLVNFVNNVLMHHQGTIIGFFSRQLLRYWML
ncbi:hypothetical protein AQUCO_01000379v1 [Aquilegia coerulea]|uniref:F-box domain-containing protein n=1 Tax=Aquilegia coerulea TaxID=218851 RepID=A0A2G5E9M0_AQUCA|nr:hypothetical protein AQUCO_01000379v1 [Aquilegia coerulea]